ncbi:hypothetical protein [Beijerinckia mobilis]|uniref:hypothetical protein n=1 Tax=Beijerinckia mobilis TaxID=231434 RepID=UPI0005522865|nr:hypothetical protein [Beijerinckia mobilis]
MSLPKVLCIAALPAAILGFVGFKVNEASTKQEITQQVQTLFDHACGLLAPISPQDNEAISVEQYDALVDAGMMLRSPKAVYALTAQGQAVFQFRDRWPIGQLGLCAYHFEDATVEDVSFPEIHSNHFVRHVTFTFHTRYEDWAKTPSVQKAYHGELGLSRENRLSAPMVLTKSGWVFVEPLI